MKNLNSKRLEQLGRSFLYRTRLTEEKLANVPLTYREFRVHKRDGRERRLCSPNSELKYVQRIMLRKVFQLLPVHPAAKGFRRRQGIVDHALLHSGKPIVVLMDIEDFFNSTQGWRVSNILKGFGWSQELIDQIVRIVCHPETNSLPQGAPTSPVLSNIVNWELDVRLTAFARKRDLVYSRYADDIAFSPKGSGKISNPYDIIRIVNTILVEYGYVLRAEKSRVLRSCQQQNVTGLVVNNTCNLSRSVRRRMRSAEHRLSINGPLSSVTESGEATPMTPEQLRGWQGYAAMISKRVQKLSGVDK